MICVFFSFKKEVASILEKIEGIAEEKNNSCMVYEGSFKNIEVRFVRTGMGYREIGDDLLSGCSAVISTGFCGGLSPYLKAGDIVLSQEIVYVNSKTIKSILTGGVENNIFKRNPVLQVPGSSPHVRALKTRLQKRKTGPNGIHVHVGRTVTSERVLYGSEEKNKIHNYFDAVAVDMEDFFRAAYVQRRQMPVVCARAVLDRADDAVPSIKSIASLSAIPGLLVSYKKARHTIAILLEYLIDHFEGLDSVVIHSASFS